MTRRSTLLRYGLKFNDSNKESVEVMVIGAFIYNLVKNILPQAPDGFALQNRLILCGRNRLNIDDEHLPMVNCE